MGGGARIRIKTSCYNIIFVEVFHVAKFGKVAKFEIVAKFGKVAKFEIVAVASVASQHAIDGNSRHARVHYPEI